MLATLEIDVRGKPLSVTIGKEEGRYVACAELQAARGAVTVLVAVTVDAELVHAAARGAAERLRAMLGLSEAEVSELFDSLASVAAERYLTRALGEALP